MNAQQIADREAALAAREQALQTREQTVQSREVEFAERDAAAQAAAARAEAVAFAEQLVAGGQLLPRDRDGLVAVLSARTIGDTVAFGEGDDRFEGAASAWLRDFFKRLPKQVEFSELTAPGAGGDQAQIKVPQGYSVRADRMSLHARAVAFAEANSVDYVTAVIAVERAG